MTARRFEIHVEDDELLELRARLATTRLPPAIDGDWDTGVKPGYLAALVDHWRTAYDWRAREAELNRSEHFVTELRGRSVHYIHERGRGPAPLPIVLTHGYPDSFLRFRKLIPLLVDPPDPADAFDVVVPSLPGFTFSDEPAKQGGIFHVADLWHELMTELGYTRYAAHGGDWGSTVTEHLGRSHASAVVGVHLTDVPFWHLFQKPHDLSPAERAFIAKNAAWQPVEGAYAMLQGRRPRTLADALDDSPAGLAAWLLEKFERWSDCDGDLDRRFTKDELLDHVMLYWTTRTSTSSSLPYFDIVHASVGRWILEKVKDLLARSKVPAGFALFPRDISNPPREWAERFFDVQRWTEMPRGGHFAAHEEPELLAEDLREFFRPLRSFS
jgi:pimeloyl-ACP methyl ester carboxylesterase